MIRVIGVVVIATEEIKMNSLILGGQQHIERNKRNQSYELWP